MALPPKIKPGDEVSATKLNAIRSASGQGLTSVTALGVDTIRTPAGTAFAQQPTPEQFANAIQCEFVRSPQADDDLVLGLLYSPVEIHEGIEGFHGPVLAQCRLPSQDGFSRVGILLQEVGIGEVAWVQIAGVSPIKFSLWTGDTIPPKVGGRLGAAGGSGLSQNAAIEDGGPFRILQIERQEDGPTVPGIAVVEITGKRLDAKLINADALDPTISGPYHTIVYGDGFTVIKSAPGEFVTT